MSKYTERVGWRVTKDKKAQLTELKEALGLGYELLLDIALERFLDKAKELINIRLNNGEIK